MNRAASILTPLPLLVIFGILAAFLTISFPHSVNAQPQELPSEFKQILPRGAIPAISKPKFVPAKQAQIAPESWIMGVYLNGQAKAYSLSLLNRHEVVNDKNGNTAFAAVW